MKSTLAGTWPGQPGVDSPDSRGRTGLDLAGIDLNRNPDVGIIRVEVTSEGWHVLRRTTFTFRRRDGQQVVQQRETYDRGNGATILMYDHDRRTVLLTRQFRFPAYVNEHIDGISSKQPLASWTMMHPMLQSGGKPARNSALLSGICSTFSIST